MRPLRGVRNSYEMVEITVALCAERSTSFLATSASLDSDSSRRQMIAAINVPIRRK